MFNSIKVGGVRLGVAVALVVQFAATTAMAQAPSASEAHDEEARALFEAGRAAFAEGRYEEALERFRASYTLSPRPTLLYNIGHAADRLRRDDEALEAFGQYLAALPDAPNRAEVESRVAAIRAAREATEGAATASPIEPTLEREEPANENLAEAWWLWTIVGVVVVGAGVGIGVGVAVSTPAQPAPGDVGGVVWTLGGTW